MIKISSLNKIYKSKKRKVCHALKDINLTLPDVGLVFVLGKSGSGKSTLLNLIGGLDNISSGSIEVDGNDLSKFREGDFCNYRNTHIGFIFQDYHLIDELTVYENIVLSLNLRRIEDKELVKAALEKVDLAGYEDRYPTELSGGERQRVAIARAIVKNPRIILADEPTGNLDTHTATAIITLLKQLSKDCLILIVSHNVSDANSYADRIIELKKGEIISDVTRNPDFADEVTLDGDRLIYPNGLALSDRDIDFINRNKGVDFVKRTDKFISTVKNEKIPKKIKIENKNLSLIKELNLSGKFLKNKALAISLSAFMVSVIMVIMALAQTIVAFDGSHIIAEEMAKSRQDSLLINKILERDIASRVDGQFHVEVDKDDIQRIRDAGYKGEIYPVLNATLPITEYRNGAGVIVSPYSSSVPYLSETLGTIIVDEDFLIEKFGKIEYLARLDKFAPEGVIITDYVADSILNVSTKYAGKSYEDLLGDFYKSDWTMARGTINAIIYTGYKEKHADLLESIEKGETKNISDLIDDNRYISFVEDLYDRLGYTYSLDQGFKDAFIDKWASFVVYNQRLLINGVPRDIGIHYYAWGATSPALRDAWSYTVSAPIIPDGAKYIRVAFGVTSKAFDTSENPLYEIFALEHARLVFSDGSSPSEEQFKHNIGVGLGNDGNSVKSGWNWPTSHLSDYIAIPEGTSIKEFVTYTVNNYAFCSFYDENKNFISSYSTTDRNPLPNSTIIMNVNDYNKAFNTNYDSSNLHKFVPHKVTLTQYRLYDADFSKQLFETEVTITGLQEKTSYLSDDVAKGIAKNSVYATSLYLNGTDGIGKVVNLAKELNYEPQSASVEGIHSMTAAVDVFVPIFEFLSIFLYIAVIFILMNFSSKMIGDKMHEIGILKALGTKNSSISVVFGLQVGLIALLTCGLSTLGYYLFIDVANDILIESVHRIAPSWNMPDLQFLIFKPEIALMNCALIFVLAFVSLIFPMIKIKAIKPVKIIKAKE